MRRQLSNIDQVQGRLLLLAALFLSFYAATLTLSPAARARTWEVPFRWDHWAGLGLWLVMFFLAHIQSTRWLPHRDPYLLPVASLLSGWGLLSIWRLMPGFGFRQTLWLAVALVIFMAGLRLPEGLNLLRRYKYLWLTGGLLITGLTLLFGTNPTGADNPRLWLGCCGLYFQPSEPLKLLLIVYLAAYLAGGQRSAGGRRAGLSPALPVGVVPVLDSRLLPLLAPTLVMTGLALLLLLVQRDLGTASVFLFLYAAILYVASGRKRVLFIGLIALVGAGVVGYWLFDVVQVRVNAWVNPWLDPSGRSFQIVQSLLAVANGGLIGRGPGLGSPGLVPVPHSDFIFTAIVEESGLLGAAGLLLLLGLLAWRGLSAAMNAADSYRRFLAAGLTAFLVAQSILIIGGNLRLLPLTGVTLPFVSYGGSSLLTSIFALLILIHISSRGESRPAPLPDPRPYLNLAAFLLVGLAAAALATGWWAVVRTQPLLERTDNARRAISDRFVRRGAILDRQNSPLAISSGSPGEYTRQVIDPNLSSILGYTHPIYGQAGLEASLDPILRGIQGNPGLTISWNYLLFGQPPPGLDVRLSLDLELQRLTDQLLAGHTGAVILLEAESGQILSMASHPTFDANRLDQDWPQLVQSPEAPLLNRATQGMYAPGAILGPFLYARVRQAGDLPSLPSNLAYSMQGETLICALSPSEDGWETAITAGCPGAVAALGEDLGGGEVVDLFEDLGLFEPPALRLPAAGSPAQPASTDPAAIALGYDLAISPLQMALAAASLSTGGTRPAPHLVTAIHTPQAGWVLSPPQGEPQLALDPEAAAAAAEALTIEGSPFWFDLATAPAGDPDDSERVVTWAIGGSLPTTEGSALAIAVLIEEQDPRLAQQIGQTLLQAGLQP